MSPLPTCPWCMTNDDVERLKRPIGVRAFWCGRDNVAFEGTREEWDANAEQRRRLEQAT